VQTNSASCVVNTVQPKIIMFSFLYQIKTSGGLNPLERKKSGFGISLFRNISLFFNHNSIFRPDATIKARAVSCVITFKFHFDSTDTFQYMHAFSQNTSMGGYQII
jgi:hypothetical protein